jgi:hypothetical protein
MSRLRGEKVTERDRLMYKRYWDRYHGPHWYLVPRRIRKRLAMAYSESFQAAVARIGICAMPGRAMKGPGTYEQLTPPVPVVPDSQR